MTDPDEQRDEQPETPQPTVIVAPPVNLTASSES